jgi:4-hydroxythreonine-4-phosphate dehydrogenase
MMATRPIVLTCGDPSGVGPELAVAARKLLGAEVPFFWLGDARHLPPGTAFQQIAIAEAATSVPPDRLPVLQLDFPDVALPGQPAAANAASVIHVIERAVEMVQKGEAAGLCTAPIHKKALKDGAGFAFPGHTEFLAHLAGVDQVVMMLASPLLRVVPVTIHIALAEVKQALTGELLEKTIRIAAAGLQRDFGIAQPRLAVAGLNPHAGEGGAMGREEIDLIIPILDKLRREGFLLAGPASADTMFHARARAGYDAAICMYHDQALIPIKTLDFDGGVNVTLGLPFVRTSPDHGTAYDIAGQGIARPDSMIAALRMAATMAQARSRLPS